MQNKNQFRENVPYVAYNADLVRNLDGQDGTFEAIYGSHSFAVSCEDLPGHSPVITSLIPTGSKHVWLITKVESQPANTTEDYRTRSASAGR